MFYIHNILNAELIPAVWLILHEIRGDVILGRGDKKLPKANPERPVYARSELEGTGILHDLEISFKRLPKGSSRNRS